MKPPPRDYLAIAGALIAILLCGYGVGFLVGERLTQKRLDPGSGSTSREESWENATLKNLTEELKLTEEQRNEVEREIRTSAEVIEQARLKARGTYRNELLDLHQRLLPYLDPRQRKQIEKSKRRLQEMLDESS